MEMGPVRITLGNDPLGRNNWEGAIHWIAIHDRALTEEDVLRRQEAAAREGSGALLGDPRPRHLYRLDEEEGDRIRDSGRDPRPLCIPPRFPILHPQFLYSPRTGRMLGDLSWGDRFFNILAFALLAFLFMAHFAPRARTLSACIRIAAAMVAGIAFLSLFVEILQAWLPGRHSSIMDWVCNMLGAGIGSVLYALLFVRRGKPRAEDKAGTRSRLPGP
jgi:hypothetical protein